MMVGVTDPDTDIDMPAGAGESHHDPGADREPVEPGRRRRVDKTLLIVSVLVGLGLTLMVRGLLIGITGEERANLPELIEQVDPVPESVQVLSQSNVFVDLASGYTGVLVIDGVELETINVDEIGSVQIEPGQQVDLPSATIYEPGNATLTFAPGENTAIGEFAEGEHSAQVIYWRVEDGRQRARSYTWTFHVV